MVTANILRETWQAVVEAYKEDVAFISTWSEVLDTTNDQDQATCKWLPPQVQLVPNGNTTRQLFTVNLFFEDNHEGDRSTDTRDDVYERMQVVAAHCLLYYRELYVKQNITYQGVTVRLQQEGPATFTTAFDAAGTMATGCRLTVTFATDVQFCATDYFNA